MLVYGRALDNVCKVTEYVQHWDNFYFSSLVLKWSFSAFSGLYYDVMRVKLSNPL
jgi:hypothetical protein